MIVHEFPQLIYSFSFAKLKKINWLKKVSLYLKNRKKFDEMLLYREKRLIKTSYEFYT